ncbi:dihydropyrimidinase [Trichuris trichiura]|uniref:dihydropyrimidinase n=1 Tax=Trichuris trichiura TaxID=36087 RepID=A0A077YYH5_TRITR|nr:dihydropyrimidinase [Trichuris trichiura]
MVADILIKGGKICVMPGEIERDCQLENEPLILLLLAVGGIDSHTHFGCQSMGIRSVDDFASGTKAALAGGTTMIINCVDSTVSESLMSSFEKWKKQADQQVYCDYALSVLVPKWSEGSKKDMAELVKNHGVNSFKFSTASKSAPMLNDCELYEALKHCRQLGALARIHAEHGDLISMVCKEEELLTFNCALRACSLSQLAGCPLNLPFVVNKHVAKSVAHMKTKGLIVFGETTAACLAVNGNNYFHTSLSHAAAHVTSPPLRPDPTIGNGLIRRLASGELEIVSSGHCAFNSEQRSKTASGFGKIPQGVTGAEERMMILWQKGVNTGMLDPMRFVAVISSNAAKLFNLYPSKGRVAVDSDADLVVWDPFAEKILSTQNQWSKADCSIYEGIKCFGTPVITIVGGRIAFEEGQVKVPAGSGKYISVAPFCPLAFSRIVMTDALQAKTAMNNFEGQHQKRMTRITKPPGGDSHGLW